MIKIGILWMTLVLVSCVVGGKLRIRPRKKELNIYVKEKEIITCLFNRRKITDVEWLVENDDTGLSVSVEEANIDGIFVERRKGRLELIMDPDVGAGYHFICSGYDDSSEKPFEKSIHVNIIEPARIINEETKLLYQRGTNATIHCDTVGYPVPRIQWMFKEHLDDEYKAISEEIEQNVASLVINNITDHQEGWYQCEVFQDHLLGQADHYHLPVAFQVLVDSVPENQRIVTDVQYEALLGNGGEIHLTCETSNRHELSYKWTKKGNEGTILHTGKQLTLANPTLEDSGTYICAAYNTWGSNTVEAPVDIYMIPNVTVSGVTACRRGQPVVVHCSAVGKPEPEVQFLRNDEKITNDTQDGISVVHRGDTADLVFERCFTEYDGRFECKATNTIYNEEYSDIQALDVDVYMYTVKKWATSWMDNVMMYAFSFVGRRH